jgi:hypothetical protein
MYQRNKGVAISNRRVRIPPTRRRRGFELRFETLRVILHVGVYDIERDVRGTKEEVIVRRHSRMTKTRGPGLRHANVAFYHAEELATQDPLEDGFRLDRTLTQ